MVSDSRCPSIHIFLVMGGEAGAVAPKGSMTYAIAMHSHKGNFLLHQSVHPGVKQVSISKLVGVNGKGVSESAGSAVSLTNLLN